MSKVMTKRQTGIDVTATGAKTAVPLTETPFLGGQGRSIIFEADAAIGGSGVYSLQGHDGVDNAAPDDGDSGWYNIVTGLNAAAGVVRQEIEAPRFFRVNVTTAGTGTLAYTLTGVQ